MLLRKVLHPYLILAIFNLTLFIGFADVKNRMPPPIPIEIPQDRVVINAPLLVLLYGSDRFLAANIESMRLAATSFNYYTDELDIHYLVRSQYVVAQLNPCHEDNYYWANGFLTHSGAVDIGNNILIRASNCRIWDGIPSFLYATNLMFIKSDTKEAIKAFKLSASRWKANAIMINNILLSITTNQFDDAKQALDYLEQQRNQTSDERTKRALDRRITRIEQLIVLRNAQKEYEAKYGELEYLDQLVERQILDELPEDPLFLGFEIRNGRVEIKQIKFNQEQYETP